MIRCHKLKLECKGGRGTGKRIEHTGSAEILRHLRNRLPDPDNIKNTGSKPKSPYESVKAVWKNTKIIIPLMQILLAYIEKSLPGADENKSPVNSKERKRIFAERKKKEKIVKKGIMAIYNSYNFAANAFEETARLNPEKRFRDDGVTPVFSHSTRNAIVAAHLGADAENICMLLEHDLVEDCEEAGITLDKVKKESGLEVSELVALLTKPKMEKTAYGPQWVFLVNNQKKWEEIETPTPKEYYQSRYQVSFSQILNTGAEGITPEMKAIAYIGKWIDGIDSIVTDGHLEQYKADIRVRVLLGERHRLHIVAPELDKVFLRLIRDRGYTVDDRIIRRSVAAEKVLELPPITSKSFNCEYLDKYPEPNGTFFIYSKDKTIEKRLARGTFKSKIRLELPHNSPKNSLEMISRFFENKLDIKFGPGKSLAPWASSGSGTIMWVRGIRTKEQYDIFKKQLGIFHDRLERLVSGNAVMV